MMQVPYSETPALQGTTPQFPNAGKYSGVLSCSEV